LFFSLVSDKERGC